MRIYHFVFVHQLFLKVQYRHLERRKKKVLHFSVYIPMRHVLIMSKLGSIQIPNSYFYYLYSTEQNRASEPLKKGSGSKI